MLTIRITSNTVLKRSAAQASSLPPSQKFMVQNGWTMPIAGYSEESGHYRIVLGKDSAGKQLNLTTDDGTFNTWYVWAQHAVILKDGLEVAKQEHRDMVLSVPFFSQRDNYTQASRTCNSSSCAMVLKFLKPSAIRDDDQYLKTVLSIGDTTSQEVQTAALRRYGQSSVFRTDLDYNDVERELRNGRPVVLGILHRGTLLAPTGGHMIVAIGIYKDGLICHDPYGDLMTDYWDADGRAKKYPYRVLDYRWQAEGSGSGWGRIFR